MHPSQLEMDMQAIMMGMEAADLHFRAYLNSFKEACIRRDWANVDKLGLDAVSAMEVYLDATAMAYKRLELAEATGR